MCSRPLINIRPAVLALMTALLVVCGCSNRGPNSQSGSTTGTARTPPVNLSVDKPSELARPAEPAPTGNVAVATAPAGSAAETATSLNATQPSPTEPLAAPSDPSDTSASWPNFRNGTDLRGVAGTTLPEKLELLWQLETHDGVTSTAAISGGFVYVAELSGLIRRLDLHSGQELWKYRTIESQDLEEFAAGFNAPVTLSDTGVFVGDEEGKLYALDRESGRPLWKPFETGDLIKGGVTILPPDPASGAPRLLFGSHDGHLYCLNAATGEQIWKFDTRGPVNGSQAIHGEHTFVSGCDQPILRVVNTNTGEQHAEIPLDGSLLVASPALVGDVLYFGTPDGEVIALDWIQQQRVWTYKDPGRKQEIHSSPAVTDKLAIIGSRDKRLHAIDRLTGERVWAFETKGPIDSSPVVVRERIFFGSADRNVYAVDFSGQEVWKHNTGHRISASPAVGEGHLVIGCEGSGGAILCFGAMK